MAYGDVLIGADEWDRMKDLEAEVARLRAEVQRYQDQCHECGDTGWNGESRCGCQSLIAENARLRAALQTLWDEVNNIRNDLGTNYPALAEAWQRAASALLWHERR